MAKVTLLLCCAYLLAGCASSPKPASTAAVRSSMDDFMIGRRYPFRAAKHRRAQIERAAHEVRKGTTEAELLSLLGAPDYQAPFVHWDKATGQYVPHAEVWHYVHTCERPITPDYKGIKVLIVTLTTTKPRTVVAVDAGDFRKPKTVTSNDERMSITGASLTAGKIIHTRLTPLCAGFALPAGEQPARRCIQFTGGLVCGLINIL